MSKFSADAHKRAALSLGHALTLADFEGWDGFTTIISARLDPKERAALAWASLRSLDADDALNVAEAVLTGADYPLPPFLAPMEDARWWADLANRRERKAYALAAYEAMSPADQAAFLDHVTDRRAAA